MRLNLLSGTERADFVVIDSQFPQRNPLAFRNAEINEYLRRIKNFSSYSMYPMPPGKHAWFGHSYGMKRNEFKENLKGYLSHHPENAGKVRYLNKAKNYNFKLSYSYFLAETYTLLPFYEKHKIPFVFVLYPGGGFGLNLKQSDNMLRQIFQSAFFRGVIVTQQITKDYLIQKKLCAEDKVDFIYGGFVQFKEADVRPKKYYKKDKPTFDICFVAAKYSEKGVDKGYDLFIETAKVLCEKTEDIMFHVVGGFDAEDINVSSIKSRIKFYGYRQPAFLVDFYAGMDIFLSPNRPFQLFDGNFDGFPLGIDSGFSGVALFVADELKMNHYYKDGKEIVIIPLELNAIISKVLHYYKNQEDLYKLSAAGQLVTQKLFDINYQIDKRINVFKKHVKLEMSR